MGENLEAVRRELNELRGRVAAAELLLTPLIAQAVVERHPSDPIGGCAEVERDVIASLQVLDRNVDQDSDQAWADMAEAIRRIFFNVRARLAHQVGR